MGKYPLNLILGAMGLLSTVNLAAQPQYDYSNMQREKLDRGVVAVKSGNSVFVSWRFFDTDPEDTQFEAESKKLPLYVLRLTIVIRQVLPVTNILLWLNEAMVKEWILLKL